MQPDPQPTGNGHRSNRVTTLNRVGINSTSQLCPVELRQPLRRGNRIYPGELFKHWDAIYGALIASLGSRKRAEMVLYALRVQSCSQSGLFFQSSKQIARFAGASRETWHLTLKALKEHGLVHVRRLHRGNGYATVNLTDFYRLFRALVKALRFGARGWRKRATIEVRIAGAWVGVVDVAGWEVRQCYG